jgi:2-polyprenyl-3-methyl-5-hydroxy-6-metoxy-1,4-benzoquinol methylase
MSSRFQNRSSEEEIMDDLDCSGEVVFQTLRELEIINRLLGGNNVTLDGIQQLLNLHSQNEVVAIADLGCGAGDILKTVSRWGRKSKKKFQLHGIDANPNIVGFARLNTSSDFQIQYEVMNVLSDEFRSKKYDIFLATLFMHHFTNNQLMELLESLKKRATIGIVVNDIHRHWLSYYFIRLMTLFFSKSSMVKFDAPLSVLRAFSRRDWELILNGAGISNYSLRWKWAFRWQLIIPKQGK